MSILINLVYFKDNFVNLITFFFLSPFCQPILVYNILLPCHYKDYSKSNNVWEKNRRKELPLRSCRLSQYLQQVFQERKCSK